MLSRHSYHVFFLFTYLEVTPRLSCGTGDIMNGHSLWSMAGACVFKIWGNLSLFGENQELRVKTLLFRDQNEWRHVFGCGVSPAFVETLACWLTSCGIYLWCLAMSPARISLGRHKRPFWMLLYLTLEMFLTRRVNNRRAIIWGWNFKGTGHICCISGISGIPNIFVEVFTKWWIARKTKHPPDHFLWA